MADEFEKIIQEIGAFGPSQIIIFIIINLGDFQTAWLMLLPVFISAKPDWTCHQDSPNTSTVSTNTSTSSYNIYTESNVTHNSTSAKCVSKCDHHYMSDFTSIISEWDLTCSKSYIASLVTTIQMVGVLFGALILSQLSDLFGRKKIWYSSLTVNSIFGIATAFSTSWEMFAAFRFMNGFCLGGLLNINYLYPMEFIGPKWRPLCGNLGFWQAGVMSLSLVAYFVRDWRNLCLCTSIPPLLLIFTWWIVPESPRWLAMRKRFKESEEILSKIAKRNNRSIPEFGKLKNFVEAEEKKFGAARKFSYIDLFRTPSMTIHTFILMYAWFVCAAVFYGLSLNIRNLAGDRYLNNMIGGFVDLPAVLLTIYTNNASWCGRKKTLFTGMLISGIAPLCVLFINLSGDTLDKETIGTATVVFAMIGKFGIAMSWSTAYLLAAEIFPTLMRSIGSGACSIASRIGGIVAPQFVFLHNIWPPLPFIVFGSLGLISAVTVPFLPETRGQPLPDAVPAWSWNNKSADVLVEMGKDGAVNNLQMNSNRSDKQTSDRKDTELEQESPLL